MKRDAILLGAVLVLGGCISRAGVGASPVYTLSPGSTMPPSDAAKWLIDLSPIPATLPATKITSDEAIAAALRRVRAGAGPVTQVLHGQIREGQDQPPRTSWIIVFGSGGTIPVGALPAPASGQTAPPPGPGFQTIIYRGVAIDDQTGQVITAFALSR